MIHVYGRTVWGPNLVVDKLSLYLDAGNERSLSGGDRWYDLTGAGEFSLSGGTGQGFVTFTQSYATASGSEVDSSTGDAMTVEALVRFDDSHSARHTIVSNMSIGPTQATGWSFYLDRFDYDGMPAGSLRLQYGAQGSYVWNTYSSEKASVLDFDSWHHVAVAAAGLNSSSPTVAFYVDGRPMSASFSTAATKVPVANDPGPEVRIGSTYLSPTQSWTASISLSQVRKYSRALSAEEVTENYQAFRTRFLPPDNPFMVGGIFSLAGNATPENHLRGILQVTSATGSLVRTSAGFGLNRPVGPKPVLVLKDSTGRLVVGGLFDSYAGAAAGNVVRLNQDLSVDQTFDTGVGFDGVVSGGAIDSSGRILLTGDFANYKGASAGRLIRLNPDGSVDTTFSVGTGLSAEGYGCVIDSQERIIVHGLFTSYNGTTANRIVRLTATGSVDPSFAYSSPGFNGAVNRVALDSSERIWAGGAFTTYGGFGTFNRIVALNQDGTVYTGATFGTGFNSTVNAILHQSDGRVLVSGAFTTYRGVNVPRLVRLNADGSPDSTFPSTTYNGPQAAWKMAQLSDGKILAGGGMVYFDDAPVNTLFKFSTASVVDQAFSAPAINGYIRDFVEHDGVVTLVGPFSAFMGDGSVARDLVKVREDSTADPAFSSGGFRLPLTRSDNIQDIQRIGDRTAVVGGFLSYAGLTSVGMAIITATGGMAPGFNLGDGFQFQVGGRPYCIAPTTWGEIYVGGQFTAFNNETTPTFIRIDQSGNKVSPDIVSFPGYGAINSVLRARIDYRDRIIIRGTSLTSYGTYSVNNVARLNPDSLSVDVTFNAGTGLAVTAAQHGWFDIDRSNRIIFTGDIGSYDSTSVPKICRVREDGSLDLTFNTGTGFNRFTHGAIIQDDGRVVVWGYFDTFNGGTASAIVRLNDDGTVDPSFSSGLGFGGGVFAFPIVYHCSIDKEGRIIACGSFTYYDGYPVSNLARINPDGSLDKTFTFGVNGITQVVRML